MMTRAKYYDLSHVIPEFPELSTYNQQHNFLGTKQLKKFEPSFASVEKKIHDSN